MNRRLVWTTLLSVPTLTFILMMLGNVSHYLEGFLAGARNLLCRFLSFSTLLLLLCNTGCSEHQNIQTLCLGSTKAIVEIADDSESIRKGLQGRSSETLCADCGMLFDWGNERSVKFWMKNTSIPLDIAYIDTAHRIVSINSMVPYSESHITSSGPVRYALEMHKDWFEKNELSVGDAFAYCS